MDSSYINQTPIWNCDSKRGDTFIRKDVLLDGCNAGPILNSQNATPGEEFSIKISKKDVSAPFPLHQLSNAWPFRSQSSREIVHSSSDLKNLVSTFQVADNNYILHPQREEKCVKLFLSEVIRNTKKSSFKLNYVSVIEDLDNIHYIDSFVKSQSAFTLLLGDDKIEHIRLDDTKKLSSISSKTFIDCSLHKTFADHFYVMSSSSAKLYCDQRPLPLWTVNFDDHMKNSLSTCRGGFHPYSVYISNKKNVWSFDCRDPASLIKNDVCILVSLKDVITQSEDICSIEPIPQTPYMYVNCTSSSLLIDSRFNKSPVLLWQHLLKAPPIFSFIHQTGSVQAIGMLDRYRRQISCIATDWNPLVNIGNTHSITGISLPKDFNFYNETFLEEQVCLDDDSNWLSGPVQNRIKSPIIGMSSFSHNDTEFSVSYINNYGDIFIQPFSNIDDPENRLSQENYTKTLRRFEDTCLSSLAKPSHKLNQIPAIPLIKLPSRERTEKRTTFITDLCSSSPSVWNIQKVITGRRLHGKYQLKPTYIDNYIADNGCSMNPSDKDTVFDYLHPQFKELLLDDDLKNCKDPFDSKFLAIWDDDVTIWNDDNPILPENGFYYGTQPADSFVTNLSKVRKQSYTELTKCVGTEDVSDGGDGDGLVDSTNDNNFDMSFMPLEDTNVNSENSSHAIKKKRKRSMNLDGF